MESKKDAMLIHEHLTHLRHLNRRPSSVEQRHWTLKRLSRYLGPTSFARASYGHLSAYLDRDMGPDARASEVSHLRCFWRWGILEGHFGADPTLRHSFATRVYRQSGGDLRRTQEALRHRSINSTVVYTYIDPTDTAATIAALPALAV